MAPKPPKERGLCTPLASPIWSTLSEGGFNGLSLQHSWGHCCGPHRGVAGRLDDLDFGGRRAR